MTPLPVSTRRATAPTGAGRRPGPAAFNALVLAFSLSFAGLPLGLHGARIAEARTTACELAGGACAGWRALRWAAAALSAAGALAVGLFAVGVLALMVYGLREGLRERRAARRGAAGGLRRGGAGARPSAG